MKDELQSVRPYKEVQKFTSPWIWIFLILFLIVFLFLLGLSITKEPVDDDIPITEYIIMIILTLLIVFLIYLFSVMRLEIFIDDKQLLFKYKPFLTRKYLLEDIVGFTERTYRPLVEFRGWGIRYSLFGHGMAYTVKGNKGVQFLIRDGKKFLLGTQKPAELTFYLNKHINSDKNEDSII